MFNTTDVGKKIAQLRKEKNLTQMELADSLGVSYQAVSNWERGNSMPDISKLPELVELLGCSIDNLLTNKKETELVEHIIKGDETIFIKENKISPETVAHTAPVLKPSQTENIMDTVLHDNQEKISIKDLIGIAPFVSEEYLSKWVDEIDVIQNTSEIIGLAPFLEEDTLDRLARKIVNAGSIKQLIGLAPFLSEETLSYLVNKISDTGSMQDLVGLAPFLEEEDLDKLVMKALENGKINECKGLYPFLGEDTLRKLADELVKKYGFQAIKDLAPFL